MGGGKPPIVRPMAGLFALCELLLAFVLVVLDEPTAGAEVMTGANTTLETVCEKSADNPPLTTGEYYNGTNAAKFAGGGYDGSVILGDDASNTGSDNVTFGMRTPFLGIVFNINTAGVSGSVQWKYSSASGWKAITPTSDPTFSFHQVGANAVRFDPPGDWAPVVWKCQDQRPMYYLMVKSDVDYTVQPLADQASVIVPNLKIKVVTEAGKPVNGLLAADFVADSGTINTVFASRALGDGQYDLALDTSGADHNFRVRAQPTAYVAGAFLDTGDLGILPTVRTSQPLQLLYPIKVVVNDRDGKAVTGATVTFGNEAPAEAPSTGNAHYFLGTAPAGIAVSATGYETFATTTDKAAQSVAPGVAAQTLITLTGSAACGAATSVAAGASVVCSGLKAIAGAATTNNKPIPQGSSPQNPGSTSSVLAASSASVTACASGGRLAADDGVFRRLLDRVDAGGIFRLCLEPEQAHGFEQVDLTAGSDLDKVEGRVETSNVLPFEWAATGPSRSPAGPAFAFMKLSLFLDGHESAAASSEAKVRFHVAKDTIHNAGAAPSDLRLFRWTGDRWSEVPTQLVSQEGTDASFLATAPGPGVYSVAGGIAVPAGHGLPLGLWIAGVLGLTVIAIGGGLWFRHAHKARLARVAKAVVPPPTPAPPPVPSKPMRPPSIR